MCLIFLCTSCGFQFFGVCVSFFAMEGACVSFSLVHFFFGCNFMEVVSSNFFV
jgi:hypothetical protein